MTGWPYRLEPQIWQGDDDNDETQNLIRREGGEVF